MGASLTFGEGFDKYEKNRAQEEWKNKIKACSTKIAKKCCPK